MSYYPYQGYYVVAPSHGVAQSSSHRVAQSSDTWNDLKKAGSSFIEWLSKLTKGNSLCANCHKNGATIRFCKEIAFCSRKCQDEALQNYQKQLGKFAMLS